MTFLAVEIGVVITVAGFALSVATFFIGRQSSAKNQAAEATELKKDVEYILKSIERIEKFVDNNDIASFKIEIDREKKDIENIIEWQKKHEKEQKESLERVYDKLEKMENNISQKIDYISKNRSD